MPDVGECEWTARAVAVHPAGHSAHTRCVVWTFGAYAGEVLFSHPKLKAISYDFDCLRAGPLVVVVKVASSQVKNTSGYWPPARPDAVETIAGKEDNTSMFH